MRKLLSTLGNRMNKPHYLSCASTLICALLFSGFIRASDLDTLGLDFNTSTVAEALPKSWSISTSPDNRIFVTHRAGGFSVLDEQWRVQTFEFAPQDLYYKGQGGLLDIEFHPQYSENGWVYLSYSSGSDDENVLKVVRFKLNENDSTVDNLEIVLVLNEPRDTPVHYGGRLAFMSDGSLLVSSGDGFDYRERAQILSSHQGKILRVSDTGQALTDNPFYSSESAAESKVFTLGHRNPQSVIVLQDGTVVTHEHGPAGGDEINFLQAGTNYGWPVVTNGMDYIGSTISPFKDYPNMRLPDHDWTPSIAPSGMVYVKNGSSPLSGRLLITSLKYKQVHSLLLNNQKLDDEKLIYQGDHRLRDITLDPQSNILLLTDGETASIIKLGLYVK